MTTTPNNLPRRKAIFALWHVANRGKTETLRQLGHLLLRTFPNRRILSPGAPPIPAQGDFRLIIDIDGLIVAIESQGDPNTGLEDRLIKLAEEAKADVIFCATRTKGETVSAVKHIAQMGYEEVWSSTYETARDRETVNALKAQHILELMRSLRLLP